MAKAPQDSNFIPLTIPAASLIQALDAVSKAGEPLVGATVRLQLKGTVLDSSMAQLTVDENLIQQLNRGENVHVVISQSELNEQPPPPPPPEAPVQDQLAFVSAEDVLQPKEDIIDLSSLFVCPWCDKVVPDELKLSHLLEAHNLEITQEPTVTSNVAAESKANAVPQEPSKKLAKLDKHCPTCGKTFMKRSQMERHIRIHTGERPFACSVCKKAFNQKNALQKHMLKHSGERPHVCPFCAYAFTQKGNLKTHIQRTHAQQAQQLVVEVVNE